MRFPAASYAMPVQYVGRGRNLLVGQQPVRSTTPSTTPRRRVDNDDLVGRVDVGPQLAFDPLQFVEEIDRHAFERHRRAFLAFERRRVERVNIGRAVRHVELLPVGGQSPAFAWVAELLDFPACFQVVDIGFVRLPRELVQLAVEQRDPLRRNPPAAAVRTPPCARFRGRGSARPIRRALRCLPTAGRRRIAAPACNWSSGGGVHSVRHMCILSALPGASGRLARGLVPPHATNSRPDNRTLANFSIFSFYLEAKIRKTRHMTNFLSFIAQSVRRRTSGTAPQRLSVRPAVFRPGLPPACPSIRRLALCRLVACQPSACPLFPAERAGIHIIWKNCCFLGENRYLCNPISERKIG